MRLWILSDLHVDLNRAHPLAASRPAHDVLVVAGDVMGGMVAGVRWLAEAGLNEQPVLYVAGNHEFYGRDRHDEMAAARDEAARHRNIHVLERDRVELGGLTVLGATLWTDYAVFGEPERSMRVAERLLSDHRLVRNGPRLWAPEDCLAEHAGSRAYLAAELAQPGAGPVLVVTHHAPSLKSSSRAWLRHPLTAAFASDCDDLAGRATLWVHGHMHSPSDYRLGGCRVICNPRGYVAHGEDRAFDPALIVEV